ncbi:phage protease [Paraburkholderia unamae]|uniref:Phage I-like protein n=1 Tax=Paraburkholderia unamae TaxID=219649 RepID=A0ABX5KIB1_9BURK|nr:phage protease [Paraburkholderia unamae]PVX80046.1 phage I-like protein [Paraburkholderia unamae]
MAKKRTSGSVVAALTVEITDLTGRSIQLLPAGRFSSVDGRPASLAACTQWVCGADQAASVVALAAQQANPMVIDYEHQTLNAQQNGQPAPAAGWFKNLEWREGQGLFATDVEWTPAAARAIADREYRFISPVFEFNARTGDVQRMRMAALTNNPGLDGMQAVALSAFFPSIQEPQMNKLLQALLTALGLDAQASEDQAVTALNAHLAKATSDAQQVAALTAEKVNAQAQIAALTAAAGKPDPSKYVPLSALTDLQSQVAVLTSQVAGRELDEVIEAALTAGKLLPTQEAWARELGKSNLGALKSFVESAPKLAALTGQQTGGREPNGGAQPEVSDPTLVAVCRQFGNKPADVLKSAPGAAQ